MDINLIIRRAQVYSFLAGAFLYPQENWTADAPLLAEIVAGLEMGLAGPPIERVELPALQAAYRRAFGLTGSLCYETEYGLPHEFRQSQELADLSGFYRAFGFEIGGAVRERPDHLGRWLGLFAHSLALNAPEGAYLALGRFAMAFVKADAARLGVELEEQPVSQMQHTPFDPDFSCSSCPAAELSR
jgi:nitrate reductase assembly molybdenum cofactor insertion protein NarJ